MKRKGRFDSARKPEQQKKKRAGENNISGPLGGTKGFIGVRDVRRDLRDSRPQHEGDALRAAGRY